VNNASEKDVSALKSITRLIAFFCLPLIIGLSTIIAAHSIALSIHGNMVIHEAINYSLRGIKHHENWLSTILLLFPYFLISSLSCFALLREKDFFEALTSWLGALLSLTCVSFGVMYYMNTATIDSPSALGSAFIIFIIYPIFTLPTIFVGFLFSKGIFVTIKEKKELNDF
jgi:hypothetical protein